MDWFLLVSLLSIGLVLVLTEILFVPGTTVVGILGLLVTIGGIYYAFITFGPEVGWLVLGISILVNMAVIIYGFRSGVWTRFALRETISSRSFDDRLLGLEIGMRGKTISDLKPFGKAEFLDRIFEVKSDSGFISVGSSVIITKLEDNKIIVKV